MHAWGGSQKNNVICWRWWETGRFHYRAIFLPSSDISTALLLANAFLFLSCAARMCLIVRVYYLKQRGQSLDQFTCRALLLPFSWSWTGLHQSGSMIKVKGCQFEVRGQSWYLPLWPAHVVVARWSRNTGSCHPTRVARSWKQKRNQCCFHYSLHIYTADFEFMRKDG